MHKLHRGRMRNTRNELDCFGAEPLIEAYVDGELSSAERGALEGHLEGCESCTGELDLARRIQDELHALPSRSCPPAVTKAVLDHAESHPPLAVRLQRWWSARHVWQPAFALLVVVALAVGYWRSAGPPTAVNAPS